MIGQGPIPTSFYITVENDAGMRIYLHYYIIPTLFVYFLVCHPYIHLHFLMGFFLMYLAYVVPYIYML